MNEYELIGVVLGIIIFGVILLAGLLSGRHEPA